MKAGEACATQHSIPSIRCRPGFESSRAIHENTAWFSRSREENVRFVSLVASISARLLADRTPLAGFTYPVRAFLSRSFRYRIAAVLSVQIRKSKSPSFSPDLPCSSDQPVPPDRRFATARVSYIVSTPSSIALQMEFMPGVPTYRFAAAACICSDVRMYTRVCTSFFAYARARERARHR